MEHIRVLEEAQRYDSCRLALLPAVTDIVYECRLQNAEMDRMRADSDKRDAYVRTLERARATLTQSLEDVR